MSAQLALVGLFHAHKTEFVLKSGLQTLGRSSHCELIVSDLSVSRKHAQLVVGGGTVRVADLASRNGTYVNDSRVSSCEAAEGQELRFGDAAFFLTSKIGERRELDSKEQTDSCVRGNFAAGFAPACQLTDGQRRIFDLLIEGLSEKQIASRLGISTHTVHNHVRAIYHSFSVHSRSELLALLVFPRSRGKSITR
jgi:DNA-binding CsgD family transcriptional regulator